MVSGVSSSKSIKICDLKPFPCQVIRDFRRQLTTPGLQTPCWQGVVPLSAERHSVNSVCILVSLPDANLHHSSCSAFSAEWLWQWILAYVFHGACSKHRFSSDGTYHSPGQFQDVAYPWIFVPLIVYCILFLVPLFCVLSRSVPLFHGLSRFGPFFLVLSFCDVLSHVILCYLDLSCSCSFCVVLSRPFSFRPVLQRSVSFFLELSRSLSCHGVLSDSLSCFLASSHSLSFLCCCVLSCYVPFVPE